MPAAVSVAPSQGAQVVALPTPERDRPYVRLIAGVAQRLLRDPAEVGASPAPDGTPPPAPCTFGPWRRR